MEAFFFNTNPNPNAPNNPRKSIIAEGSGEEKKGEQDFKLEASSQSTDVPDDWAANLEESKDEEKKKKKKKKKNKKQQQETVPEQPQ